MNEMENKINEDSIEKRNGSEFWLFIWEVLKIVIISLVIIVPIRYYLAQPFFVKGASMEHNFENGDYLIINEIGYYFDDPVRGEVIVFRFPGDTSQFFIKRIIGLPSETIEIKNGGVYISNVKNPTGFKLDETSYLGNLQTIGPNFRMKLDDNEYFVMGDNRGSSSDSRSWGPLNKSLIIGKAWIRAWPFNKFTSFDSITYTTQ